MTIIRPSSDIITGGWTQSTGGTLYGTIDETTASDTDYISSSTAGDKCQIQLGSTTDPGNDNNHVLRYRAQSDGDRGLIARVIETGQPPAIIMRRDVWTRQPPAGTQINWSNPLSAYLISAPQNAPWDAVGARGAWTQYNGTVNRKATEKGVSLSFSSAGFFHQPCTVTAKYAYTLFAFIRPTASGIAFSMANSGSTDTVAIQYDSGTDKFVAYLRDGGGTFHNIADTGGTRGGKFASVAVTITRPDANASSQLTGQLYIDGVFIGSSSWTWGQINPNNIVLGAQVYVYGALPSGANRISGDIIAPMLFSKVLSAPEIISLHANPWQIFTPQKRVTYFDAPKIIASQTVSAGTIGAGYDGTINLTSGEAANITNYSNLAIELEST